MCRKNSYIRNGALLLRVLCTPTLAVPVLRRIVLGTAVLGTSAQVPI